MVRPGSGGRREEASPSFATSSLGTSLPSGVTCRARCWLLSPLGFSFTQPQKCHPSPPKMPPQGREGLPCCPGVLLCALGRGAGLSGPFSPLAQVGQVRGLTPKGLQAGAEPPVPRRAGQDERGEGTRAEGSSSSDLPALASATGGCRARPCAPSCCSRTSRGTGGPWGGGDRGCHHRQGTEFGSSTRGWVIRSWKKSQMSHLCLPLVPRQLSGFNPPGHSPSFAHSLHEIWGRRGGPSAARQGMQVPALCLWMWVVPGVPWWPWGQQCHSPGATHTTNGVWGPGRSLLPPSVLPWGGTATFTRGTGAIASPGHSPPVSPFPLFPFPSLALDLCRGQPGQAVLSPGAGTESLPVSHHTLDYPGVCQGSGEGRDELCVLPGAGTSSRCHKVTHTPLCTHPVGGLATHCHHHGSEERPWGLGTAWGQRGSGCGVGTAQRGQCQCSGAPALPPVPVPVPAGVRLAGDGPGSVPELAPGVVAELEAHVALTVRALQEELRRVRERLRRLETLGAGQVRPGTGLAPCTGTAGTAGLGCGDPHGTWGHVLVVLRVVLLWSGPGCCP